MFFIESPTRHRHSLCVVHEGTCHCGCLVWIHWSRQEFQLLFLAVEVWSRHIGSGLGSNCRLRRFTRGTPRNLEGQFSSDASLFLRKDACQRQLTMCEAHLPCQALRKTHFSHARLCSSIWATCPKNWSCCDGAATTSATERSSPRKRFSESVSNTLGYCLLQQQLCLARRVPQYLKESALIHQTRKGLAFCWYRRHHVQA